MSVETPEQEAPKAEGGMAKAADLKPPAWGPNGFQMQGSSDPIYMAKCIHQSGLAPKGLDSPAKILVAMQMGAELGMNPMQAVRSIIVINGTPSLKGEVALGRVIQLGKMRIVQDAATRNDKGELTGWIFATQRTDTNQRFETTITVEDAKRAGLWGKDTWGKYPGRMLHWRAVGWHLKDYYSDVNGNIPISEEVLDYMTKETRGRVVADEAPAPGPSALFQKALNAPAIRSVEPSAEVRGEALAGVVDEAPFMPAKVVQAADAEAEPEIPDAEFTLGDDAPTAADAANIKADRLLFIQEAARGRDRSELSDAAAKVAEWLTAPQHEAALSASGFGDFDALLQGGKVGELRRYLEAAAKGLKAHG